MMLRWRRNVLTLLNSGKDLTRCIFGGSERFREVILKKKIHDERPGVAVKPAEIFSDEELPSDSKLAAHGCLASISRHSGRPTPTPSAIPSYGKFRSYLQPDVARRAR